MSPKFLLSAALASITAALLAMPAHAAPVSARPAVDVTTAASPVIQISHRRHDYAPVLRHGYRSVPALHSEQRHGYGYVQPRLHGRAHVEIYTDRHQPRQEHGQRRRYGH